MNERKLTKSELAKREDIIMKMKDNKRALVQKYGKDAEAVMYGRATNLAKKKSEGMDQDKIKELVKDALQNPKKADLNKDGKLSDYEKKRGAAIEKAMVVEPIDEIDLDLKGGTEKDKDADIAGVVGAESALGLEEDLDLGHQDNEPHMLKADLYRIGKYAMELYQMVDGFEGQGEVDFPHWWQSKVIKAKDALVGAKHYLDFEIKEPQIDTMVDRMDDIAPEMEVDVVDDVEIEEGLPKGYWDKKMDAKDEVSELLDDTPPAVVAKANNKIVNVATMAKSLLDIYDDFKVKEKIDFEANSNFRNALNFLKKAAQSQIDKETKGVDVQTEDYDALVNKIKKQGKSEKAAKAIAGAVASYKAKGGGKGPTAKQKG